MADVQETRDPISLYDISVRVVTNNFKILKGDLTYLPVNILFDIYLKLYEENHLSILGKEFKNLEVFSKILKLTACRLPLHKCFQALEDFGAGVAESLSTAYATEAAKCRNACAKSRASVVDAGLRLGEFLSDAGWYDKAETVLLACREICQSLENTPANKRLFLHCCQRLLQVQALHCNFPEAQNTYKKCLALIEDLIQSKNSPNLSGIYASFSQYYFIRSEFDDSFKYSLKALRELTPSVPRKTVIEVLRHASKSCVVKREFTRAGILIRQAVSLAAEVYGLNHPKYAEAQLDYGFYLLNYDSIKQCVDVYKSAIDIFTSIFCTYNVQIAVALEDLAYALYVREYSSGRFQEAEEKIEEAISIMEKLLPKDNIKLSSAKRVKALILEEIAIDNQEDEISEQKLLSDAEGLHLLALKLTRNAFGEKNVQTAKYYGNLGRLYQSMKKFEESEAMHLKAIALKEELLGPDDYEVGLSIGHLASIYSYHMFQYNKAIDLYLRSISISIKLFGKSYSGLEYDYRGLIHIYTQLNNPAKVAEYTYLLNAWQVLRKNQLRKSTQETSKLQPPLPIDRIVEEVFNCKKVQNQPSISEP